LARLAVGGDEEREIPPRLAAWLAAGDIGLQPPVRWRRFTGGSSNLTYQLTDAAGRRCVLRRPPDGAGQATHNVLRESGIIDALRGSAVPVASLLASCADPAVLGAPFSVMSFAAGTVLTSAAQAASTTVAYRAAVAESFIAALAAVHQVEPDAVGLAGLGRSENYVQRQLSRWLRQYQLAPTSDAPLIEDVHQRLAARVPPQARSGIVHGDYRLENVMFDEGGRVSAVLDWELATLGDTSADLAWTLLYWTSDPAQAESLILTKAATLPGFPGRRELAARYAALSGRDPAELTFYLAFASWRAACIAAGVLDRYRRGQMGAGTIDLARQAGAIRGRAELADQLLRAA
jgi:aminoglycoside phosphotransferase (APT) family kinase protein